MKIFVIGIDGLEYNLVERWDLENLKQEEYGKVGVPISKHSGSPHSVQVWGSFLKGEIFEKEVFERTNLITKLGAKISSLIGKRMGTGILNFFERKTGDRKKFPEMNDTTFLDETDYVCYNAPFYSYESIRNTDELIDFLQGEVSAKRGREVFRKRYERDKKGILNKIEENGTVFFGFFNYLDWIQHMFYMDMEFLRDSYEDVDEFIGKVKEKTDGKALFLIISDHGADLEGGHSKYAFYSVNEKLNLEKPHITDFHDIILERLNLPTSKEREEIKEDLENLGYI